MEGVTQLAFEIFIGFQGAISFLIEPRNKKKLEELSQLSREHNLNEHTSEPIKKAARDIGNLLEGSGIAKFAKKNIIGVSIFVLFWSVFSIFSVTICEKKFDWIKYVEAVIVSYFLLSSMFEVGLISWRGHVEKKATEHLSIFKDGMDNSSKKKFDNELFAQITPATPSTKPNHPQVK
jgi:hypothetical protein